MNTFTIMRCPDMILTELVSNYATFRIIHKKIFSQHAKQAFKEMAQFIFSLSFYQYNFYNSDIFPLVLLYCFNKSVFLGLKRWGYLKRKILFDPATSTTNITMKYSHLPVYKHEDYFHLVPFIQFIDMKRPGT